MFYECQLFYGCLCHIKWVEPISFVVLLTMFEPISNSGVVNSYVSLSITDLGVVGFFASLSITDLGLLVLLFLGPLLTLALPVFPPPLNLVWYLPSVLSLALFFLLCHLTSACFPFPPCC